MSLDTAQKRMSAINIGCPWRGPMIAAIEAGFDSGARAAAAFLYSGIAAGLPASEDAFADGDRLWVGPTRNRTFVGEDRDRIFVGPTRNRTFVGTGH
jgi:hypothetical protein